MYTRVAVRVLQCCFGLPIPLGQLSAHKSGM